MQHFFGGTMIFKVMLLGAQNTGKTQIVRQLSGRPFQLDYKQSIGADFCAFKNEQNLSIQLWEVGGNESNRSWFPIFMRNAHVICYCVDLSSEIDFPLMQTSLEEAISKACSGAPIILIGSKADLCENPEEKLAAIHLQGIEFQHRIAISAKDNIGLDKEDNSFMQVLWKTLSALRAQIQKEQKAEEHNKLVNSFPKSYQQMWKQGSDPANAVRVLLKDYSKISGGPGFFENLASSAKLLIAGRWNRHHHQAVLATFENQGSDVEDFLNALRTNLIAQGNTVNPEGSLARRLAFIELQTGHGINIQELNQTILNNKDQKSNCCFG
nr:DUF5617 domain-containing protein [Legionella jordanis]